MQLCIYTDAVAIRGQLWAIAGDCVQFSLPVRAYILRLKAICTYVALAPIQLGPNVLIKLVYADIVSHNICNL